MSKKGNSNTQIVGFRYFLDFLMGICRSSVDAVVAIRAGDLPAWTGDMGNGTINIDKRDLFGGDTGEGGLAGTATVMLGDDDQTVPDFIKDTIAAGPHSKNEGNWTFQDGVGVSDEGAVSENAEDISDFRGVTTIWWSGLIASNNPYLKPWKVRTRRAYNGWGPDGCWYPETAVISYAPKLSSASHGEWNASSNIPHLTSGVGTLGAIYNVTVAGNTELDGITSWSVGEMVWFDGAEASVWRKVTTGETIIKAMNPAHILYQCLTNRSWGRGMARSELDNDAWVYAANYLFNESFGLCLRWSKDGDINDFVQTVIDHIGGALYIDRGTGLMVLRLIRNDYDYDKLPLFTYTSGLLSVDTQETGASTILANEVVVKWRDPIRDQDRQTRVHNLASMQTLGYPISMSRDFPGIADPELAQRVALRELQVGSAGIKRLKLRFDRRAWRIQPGMVMRIQAPDKGINDMVLRVATYDDGTMIDGTITMDCLQDVFGLPSTVYTTPVENTSPPHVPGSTPPIVYEDAEEASYLDMIRGLSPADFAAVGDTEGGVIAIAGRPNTNSQYFAFYTTPAGGETTRSTGVYSPVAVSGRPLSYYDINISVTNGADLDNLVVGMTGVIGDELVEVTSFTPTSGTIVIARGGGDTVPVHHPAGIPVIFNDAVNSGFTEAYETSDVLTVQLQNVSSSAESDLTLAGTHTVTIVGRHFKPYVMGNLRINGQPALADTPWGFTDSMAFTWASRNRLLQSDQFVAHGDGSVTAEAGVTWTVEVWNTASGAFIRAHTGLTANTYTYDTAEKASGAPDPVALTFVFYAMRGGVQSYSAYRIPVYFVAHGETVGRAEGHGLAVGVGGSLLRSVGHAAGTSMTTNAVGSGVGPVVAVGRAAGYGGVRWAVRGLALGAGDANAAAYPLGIITAETVIAKGVGDADAGNVSTGFLTGVGLAFGISDALGWLGYTGRAVGTGAATGRGSRVAAATGSATGTGGANAVAPVTLTAVGAAAGVGTASGTGAETEASDGLAAGVGVASGVPVLTTIVSGTGTAAGTGTATGLVFVRPFSEGMIVGVGVVSP